LIFRRVDKLFGDVRTRSEVINDMDKQKTLSRVFEMNNFLLQNVKTIFRLRRIGLSKNNSKLIYAYSVSLAKDHKHTLEELTEMFYTSCGRMLNDAEELITDKKCFTVSSSEFTVHYYVEAWRKCADKLAYIENGRVKVELLNRISCEQAAYIFKKRNIDPLALINTSVDLEKYDNYADKYAALARSIH